MRKNKTWLIDLFNTEPVMRKQSANQIQNDEFWTSDTEAYLNFKVSSQEFIIDTAKINLYNKDDGTLVQRDMTKQNNEAQYELPQEIIAHFGKWNAQVVFISGAERYTSPMVDFEVKRTLGDGAPEKLGIIRDWLVFESDAKELIAEIETNEALRQADFATAQSARQATFDTSQNDKQNAFTTSESNRQSTFNTAENLRKIDENGRKVAETNREASEATRKTNEASRIADENIRKANEIQRNDKQIRLNNLIVNGDFSNGTTGWRTSSFNAEFQVVNGVAETLATVNDKSFMQGVLTTKGNKYYISFKTRVSNLASLTYARVWFGATNPTYDTFFPSENTLGRHSFVRTPTTDEGNIRFFYIGSSGAVKAFLDDVILINLTKTFGAGNEPTKEQMDELLAITGYISGERVVSHQEMFKLINARANKKQEDWITPTLLNGATGTLRYYKDDMGVVRLKGRILTVNASQTIVNLPAGYRLQTTALFPVYCNDGTTAYVSVSSDGGLKALKSVTGAFYLDSTPISYRAEA